MADAYHRRHDIADVLPQDPHVQVHPASHDGLYDLGRKLGRTRAAAATQSRADQGILAKLQVFPGQIRHPTLPLRSSGDPRQLVHQDLIGRTAVLAHAGCRAFQSPQWRRFQTPCCTCLQQFVE
ncbi:hypothetical protein D3C72_1743630 [compost metagenome]